ncbi:MAG TPA: prepilin peptidase [Candidatus Dormibacteraeota bacterium]|nr:prepilin peptidase [Candidatus Dormibacteraeota bacterium]
MNLYLVAVLWAIVGAGGGWLARWASVRLARLEGLGPGFKPWQVYGPPIVSAVLFAIFALVIPSFPLLVVRSVFVLVLVQIIFFDFEHRLILDRVIFPAMALALLVSLSPLVGSRLALWQQPWWAGPAMAAAAGVIFLLLALAGSTLFKAEALGFGDVKLAFFMGLLLGWPYTFTALFYGAFVAVIGVIAFAVRNRSLKGTMAYGPYLAAGALIMLLDPLK